MSSSGVNGPPSPTDEACTADTACVGRGRERTLRRDDRADLGSDDEETDA